MILAKYIIPIAVAMLTLLSCNNEKSLQKYLVEKQDDDAFLKVDIATSLLQSDGNKLSKEEKEILETVKKINVVAFKIKDENRATFEDKKSEIKNILNQEKYKTLITFGSNKKGATLQYTGKEDAINELIVFASDANQGFAVFRLLGDQMRPDQMIKLMKSLDNGDIDVSQLKSISEMFDMKI